MRPNRILSSRNPIPEDITISREQVPDLVRPKYHPSSVPWVPKLHPAKEEAMQWYHIVAYFFGGAFFVNAIPHFTNGVSGRRFPSPFASPPGKGLSSSTVNVLWGTLNLVVGYLLVFRVGTFDFRRTQDALIVGVGAS
jgi:hypothetical protein